MLVHLLKIMIEFLPIGAVDAIYYIPLMYLIDLIGRVADVILAHGLVYQSELSLSLHGRGERPRWLGRTITTRRRGCGTLLPLASCKACRLPHEILVLGL